ncbi:hypothetical protein AOE01nite_35280 [Acetobacter oeni]|uniref:UmuC domain-containing protein n=1 Tax=Acetobacter oeni TaxID=304077 RepID=A0A511XQU6_9PROT|nr:hypothetical protein [Acetobacter oeni]GBR05696.1 hypothetical protein AA21952_1801 [Acetobacter oeni LMG 21952]GEN65304.1 hypothetical protein AOE01nite_35280 [Acetobacter oeni]
MSYNRFLAKLASDQNKPDGLFVITPKHGPVFVATLAIEKFHGIGPATAKRMHALGIRTGEDLRTWPVEALRGHFGSAAEFYFGISRGIDNCPVNPNRQRKSIGIETTSERDMAEPDHLQGWTGKPVERLREIAAQHGAKSYALACIARGACAAYLPREGQGSLCAQRCRENDDDPRNRFHFEEVRRAIDMKREDGTIKLVGGDEVEVMQQIARLYVTRRDAADLSRAVRSILQERGEISRKEITVEAIGQRGETYDLQIAAGDRLRLYRRTWGKVEGQGKTVGNNGDVVTVVVHSKDGLRVRTKDGEVADVERRRFRDAKSGRVLLGFGFAMTVDAAQGLTSDEHINAMPRGVGNATGFTSYVAESRAKGTTWTMISDAATFEAVRNQRALGDLTPVTSNELYKALGIDVPFRTAEERDQRVQELIRLGVAQETLATSDRDYGGEVQRKVQAIALEKTAGARLADLDRKIESLMKCSGVTVTAPERSLRVQRAWNATPDPGV